MAIDRPTPQPGASAAASPEDAMPPAKRKQLQRCYERGSEMSRKDKPDFDYAHDMFSECVRQDPGNLVYVEALLDNLQRKYKNNKKGASFKGFGGRAGFKKAIAAQDWPEIFREGLDLLKVNPWDVATLRALAEACKANRYNEVELRYLKNALDSNPKDVQVNRHCAFSLTRMGQFDQAIACWHRVEELERGNEEAPKMISQLSVAKQRFAAGYDLEDLLVGLLGVAPGTKATPRVAPGTPKSNSATHTATTPAGPASSSPAAVAPAPGNDGPSTPAPSKVEMTPRQRLEQSIRTDPTNLDNFVQLAEMQAQEGRFRDAQSVLEKGLAASGGDVRMRERLEDMMIRRQRADIAIAEKQAATRDHEETRELLKRLKDELNRTELDLYSRRVERYPEDRALKLELALRLKRAANFEAAIPLFEAVCQTQEDPVASLELGECQQQLKQYGKAVRTYQLAVKAAQTRQDIPRHKLALYRLGVLASALKEFRVAQSAFTSLVDLDPEFRDASDRLDKLKQIEQNQ